MAQVAPETDKASEDTGGVPETYVYNTPGDTAIPAPDVAHPAAAPNFVVVESSQSHQNLQLSEFGTTPHPVSGTCPYCQQQMTTVTSQDQSAAQQNVLCLLLLATCCCCLIPILHQQETYTVHRCPKCNNELGRHYSNGVARGGTRRRHAPARVVIRRQ